MATAGPEETHNKWKGKRVEITGVGGKIYIDENGDVRTAAYGVGSSLFEIVAADNDASKVAFRYIPPPGTGTTTMASATSNGDTVSTDGDPKYLTIVMYGDEPRQSLLEQLASNSPLLPEMIGEVVDFTVGAPTNDDNFEGAGFNYSPMTLQPGPPNMLQVFEMEGIGGGRFGIKTSFNTYWRSQHWDGLVSQSPHRLGDELWYIMEYLRPGNINDRWNHT
eukprot:CAMPEP_0119556900 /NCGR_PEP_ID=MMETSP1352-20130426/8711_1 /TAXON_ID=265584 /ORGANISM="Stauroneis constricta, Strain CCMP1120" /LENGTH=220 /DNA_ID=CAMNT_0007603913 /DNA_START=81 /DNA_END=743 /DNA_ORIENTATION=+